MWCKCFVFSEQRTARSFFLNLEMKICFNIRSCYSYNDHNDPKRNSSRTNYQLVLFCFVDNNLINHVRFQNVVNLQKGLQENNFSFKKQTRVYFLQTYQPYQLVGIYGLLGCNESLSHWFSCFLGHSFVSSWYMICVKIHNNPFSNG